MFVGVEGGYAYVRHGEQMNQLIEISIESSSSSLLLEFELEAVFLFEIVFTADKEALVFTPNNQERKQSSRILLPLRSANDRISLVSIHGATDAPIALATYKWSCSSLTFPQKSSINPIDYKCNEISMGWAAVPL